jgi:RNA-binding protein PNO1
MELDEAPTAAEAGHSFPRKTKVHAMPSVERPWFDPLMPSEMGGGKPQFRKVPVPSHRFAPLKKAWADIYTLVYEQMRVDIRMNVKVTTLWLHGTHTVVMGYPRYCK